MQTSLIRAERLVYGPFRFRLEVRHRFLGIPFRRVYFAKSGMAGRRTWYRDWQRQAPESVHAVLEALLAHALDSGQCPPQRILACFYA